MANAAQFIFTMQKVSRFHPPDREVLKDISLSFYPGAKIGVIGPNGSGKSSLLRIMAGLDDGFTGEARLSPGFTVGLLEQEPHLDETKDVKGNVMDGVGAVADLLDQYDDVPGPATPTPTPTTRRSARSRPASRPRSRPRAPTTSSARSRSPWTPCACRRATPTSPPSPAASGAGSPCAGCCSSKPDLLLLDEPTNHLDAESVAWLERTLQDYPGTVVAITHDRYFLDNVAQWILELDHGKGIPFEGNYSQLAGAEAGAAPPRAEGRHAPGQDPRARARVGAHGAQGPPGQGQGPPRRLREAAGRGQGGRGRGQAASRSQIPPGDRLGDLVIEVEHLSKGFGDRLLIEDLVVLAAARPASSASSAPTAPARPRCSGCSPARRQPDDGTVTIGPTVELAYVDQSRDTLDPDKTVYEEITGGQEIFKVGTREVNGRAYVASFNFNGSDQQKKVGVLSGGERNRVHLAKVLRTGGNVLLLDEPTNDLDVDTLRALEDGLESFPGCAVVISHDRWFLDRIATHVLAFEGDSQVRWFEGNFTDYEEWRHKELGTAADQPHRIKYKPLVR